MTEYRRIFPVTDRSAEQEAVLRTLAYFDLFKYPLRLEEIHRFLPVKMPMDALAAAVQQLRNEERVFRFGDVYALHANPLLWQRRMAGNERAAGMLRKAFRIGRLLHRFPFVRSVGISGSLSKDYADADSDIDFFIVTAPGRLWIARTLLHAWKKLMFLRGQQRDYCMNYFIDSSALALDGRNIYTAVELRTLLPVTGARHFNALQEANNWATGFLPQCSPRYIAEGREREPAVKRCLEFCMRSRLFNWLDNWCWSVTKKRWAAKMKRTALNDKGLPMQLETGKHLVRSDAGDFQATILSRYAARVNELLQSLPTISRSIISSGK